MSDEREEPNRSFGGFPKQSLIVVGVALVAALGGLGFWGYKQVTKSPPPPAASVQQTQPSKQEEKKPETARQAADEYLKVFAACDVEKINTMRIVPQEGLTKDQCTKSCPQGYTYQFESEKPARSKTADDGATVENVELHYKVSCGGNTQPVIITMARSSKDGIWKVLAS